MKITELLDRRKETLISYEIIPPERGGSAGEIFEIINGLMEFEPPFIDVTSHAAQVYYEEMPDGSWRRRIKRKRPGTLGLCAAIKGRYGIESVPHLLCHGFNRQETEDALIELNYLGIQNVMALRGDTQGYEKTFSPDRTVNKQAIDLVGQIASMNRGRYLEELIDAEATDFCIGVAGYPEKHVEAPNMAWDTQHLSKKVAAGAHYVTTQMFFDNRHYFDFVGRCRKAGIDVPILPGLKIITSRNQLKTLPSRFHIEIPEELAGLIDDAPDDRVAEIGVDWAVRQSRELESADVPCLHFYIMKTARHVREVVSRLRKLS